MVGTRDEFIIIMKAVVFTLGCKVNECESDALLFGLSELGYQVSDKLEKADVYIVNTCAVTSEAEKKSRQTYSRIKKLNPDAKIIFTGCACQKNAQPFAKKDGNCLVTGVFEKNKILQMLGDSGIKLAPQSQAYEELCNIKSMRTRTFVKVQDGCNNFCTYCIIPYLRGRSRSRSPQKIIEEIIKNSPTEVVLTGINLSSYNYNGISLVGLIDSLKDIDCRIRLGSLEVGIINEEFLQALKNLRCFAPHFHLSLQSGSNAILKKMNRHYTREEFIQKAKLIKEFFPSEGITTDIIVGFPNETEQDFLDTLDLIKQVNFSDIHAFPFSPREGTVAYKMQDLSNEIKKQRLNTLLDVKLQIKKQFVSEYIGKQLCFLPEEFKEGYTQGYSENYMPIYVKGNFISQKIIKVKIVAHYKDGAMAEII